MNDMSKNPKKINMWTNVDNQLCNVILFEKLKKNLGETEANQTPQHKTKKMNEKHIPGSRKGISHFLLLWFIQAARKKITFQQKCRNFNLWGRNNFHRSLFPPHDDALRYTSRADYLWSCRMFLWNCRRLQCHFTWIKYRLLNSTTKLLFQYIIHVIMIKICGMSILTCVQKLDN